MPVEAARRDLVERAGRGKVAALRRHHRVRTSRGGVLSGAPCTRTEHRTEMAAIDELPAAGLLEDRRGGPESLLVERVARSP